MKSGVLKFLIHFAIIIKLVTAQQQYVRIYNGSNCDTNLLLYSFTDSIAVIADFHPTSLSLKVDGLWRFDEYVIPLDGTPTKTIFTGRGECQQYEPLSNTTFVGIFRYGDTNQEEQRLHIYQEKNLEGSRHIVSEGLLLTDPLTFGSFFFTGNYMWSIYSGVYYNETVTCLKPAFPESRYGITFNPNFNQVVGSARLGCDENISSSTTSGGTPDTTTRRNDGSEILPGGFIFIFLQTVVLHIFKK